MYDIVFNIFSKKSPSPIRRGWIAFALNKQNRGIRGGSSFTVVNRLLAREAPTSNAYGANCWEYITYTTLHKVKMPDVLNYLGKAAFSNCQSL